MVDSAVNLFEYDIGRTIKVLTCNGGVLRSARVGTSSIKPSSGVIGASIRWLFSRMKTGTVMLAPLLNSSMNYLRLRSENSDKKFEFLRFQKPRTWAKICTPPILGRQTLSTRPLSYKWYQQSDLDRPQVWLLALYGAKVEVCQNCDLLDFYFQRPSIFDEWYASLVSSMPEALKVISAVTWHSLSVLNKQSVLSKRRCRCFFNVIYFNRVIWLVKKNCI